MTLYVLYVKRKNKLNEKYNYILNDILDLDLVFKKVKTKLFKILIIKEKGK